MINIDVAATVEVTVLRKKVGTNCTEEESEHKKAVGINNSDVCLPILNSLLYLVMAAIDLDQLTQDKPSVKSDNV